jgi:hypothetical protein
MKKRMLFLLTLVVLMVITTVVLAEGKPPDPPAGKKECTTIQSGELLTSGGDVIVTGFADNGYNYQAHLFNGYWGGDLLVMKWSDSWLSNMDCDGDGKLDRHYGFPTYIGSGAWETNFWLGEYEGEDGEVCKWTYFVKIVAVPEDATLLGGIWYNAAGVEIGTEIWGQFVIIQEVWNDPCEGAHGVYYLSPDHAGFGNW